MCGGGGDCVCGGGGAAVCGGGGAAVSRQRVYAFCGHNVYSSKSALI